MCRLKSLPVILLSLLIAALSIPAISDAEADGATLKFRSMLKNRIISIIDSWPVEDQYAIMFFIYSNEAYEYRGCSNIPEFMLLYKCESDMGGEEAYLPFTPWSVASGDGEERWNPAFWNFDDDNSVIGFYEPNKYADALIDWYEAIGLERIGYEQPAFNDDMVYIGYGPNGFKELLDLAADIAKELQCNGFIESKFGHRLPIIFSDLEITWYMVKATKDVNTRGEADEYISWCIDDGWVDAEMIE